MTDRLAPFDRLRAEDPAKAEELLSQIAESDWEKTFGGGPGAGLADGSGTRRRAWKEERLDGVQPSKNRLVRRFVRDPRSELDAAYTRDPTFGWDLLAYCLEYSDAVPARAQRLTRTAIVVFSRNEREGLQESACMIVAAQGVLAVSEFMLNRLEEATATLSKAFESAVRRNCAGCRAGTLRKEAILDRERAYLGMDPDGYSRAYEKSTAAIELYSEPLTRDHDLLGHGLAHSHMTRGVILSFWNRPEAALSDLSVATHLCAGTKSRLYVLCLGNTGFVLAKSGCEEHLIRGVEIAVGLKKRFAHRRKASTERAMTYWLEGQLSARVGATDVAFEALEDALEDFVALESGGNSSAVVSDLSKLSLATPARIRAYILRLDPERARRFPSWIPGPAQDDLFELYRLCGQRVDEATLLQVIGDLRDASGSRFPCLI